MVSFPDSSATFQPTPEALDVAGRRSDDAHRLDDLHQRPHQHELRPSAARRSPGIEAVRLSAQVKYLVDRGVSPLKVMVNFASAADYITENITPEGRYQNQRVEIELVYVPMF
jgi:hypothetical protein